MSDITVGILGFQGDIEEHVKAARHAIDRKGLKGIVEPIRGSTDIQRVDALIIPGGESTVIGILANLNDVTKTLQKRAYEDMPIMGTCAGLIMLAKKVHDRNVGEAAQTTLGLMDVTVERNAFGRQRESFEADLDIPILGERFRGIFIRAPTVIETSPGVSVLSKLESRTVAVQQGNMIGTCFHPELTEDLRIYEYFLDITKKWKLS